MIFHGVVYKVTFLDLSPGLPYITYTIYRYGVITILTY